MRVTFLGTGTSLGMPVIGCDCPACVSGDPRNRRRRCSVWIEAEGFHLLIDTSPDLHAQALACGLRHLDAVLVTHGHADHIHGFDDLRAFGMRTRSAVPVHTDPATLARLRHVFDYVVETPVPGLHLPLIRFHDLAPSGFTLGPLTVEWFPVDHGPKHSLAYVLGHRGRRFAYIPDCKSLTDEQVRRLAGVDVIALDALRDTPHNSHLTLAESLATLARIRPGQAWLTHLGHELEHAATEARLPADVRIAHDGLHFTL